MSDYADPRDADSDLQSSSMDFNDDIDFMSSFFGDKDAPMLWNNDIEEAFSVPASSSANNPPVANSLSEPPRSQDLDSVTASTSLEPWQPYDLAPSMSSAQSVRPELDFSLLLPSSDFDGVEYPRNGFGVEIGQVDGDANTAHCLPFSTMPLMATTPSVYRASHNQPVFHSLQNSHMVPIPSLGTLQPSELYSTNDSTFDATNPFNQSMELLHLSQNEPPRSLLETQLNLADTYTFPEATLGHQTNVMSPEPHNAFGPNWTPFATSPNTSVPHAAIALSQPDQLFGTSSTVTTCKGSEPISTMRGPTFRIHKLPPKRRGGRKKIVGQKKANKREAEVVSVCIRCRKSGVKCSGGIPCERCIRNQNAKLWKVPCTKADFIEMIEFKPYFPYNLAHKVKFDGEDPSVIAAQLEAISLFAEKKSSTLDIEFRELFSSWPIGVSIPWSTVHAALEQGVLPFAHRKYILPLGDGKRASNCNSLARRGFFVQHEWLMLGALLTALDANEIKLYICSTNSFLQVRNALLITRDVLMHDYCDTMTGLVLRSYELDVFKKMQRFANETTFEDNGDLHAFISFALLLLLSVLPSMSDNLRQQFDLECQNEQIKSFSSEEIDRINRVRAALWVITSIAIEKLPNWSCFWDIWPNEFVYHPKKLLFQRLEGNLPKFDAFLEDAQKSVNEKFHRMSETRTGMQKLHPAFTEVSVERIYFTLLRDASKKAHLTGKTIRGW